MDLYEVWSNKGKQRLGAAADSAAERFPLLRELKKKKVIKASKATGQSGMEAPRCFVLGEL